MLLRGAAQARNDVEFEVLNPKLARASLRLHASNP